MEFYALIGVLSYVNELKGSYISDSNMLLGKHTLKVLLAPL